jgi:hypothetical protein
MPDEFHRDYQGLFKPVRPDPNVGAAAVQLYMCNLFPSEQVPSVWLYQARDTGQLSEQVPSIWLYQARDTGQIRTLIIQHMVQGVPGPVADPWTGTELAFTSDMYYGQIAPIRLPVALCDNTAAVHAPTVATMTVAVAATQEAYLGPYLANALDTEELYTQGVVPVPHKYVPLVLFRSLTPREAWLQLGEDIVQDQ